MCTPSQRSFVPLNDLLKKSHKDRVKDYLKRMEEENRDATQSPTNNKMDESKSPKNKLPYSQQKELY